MGPSKRRKLERLARRRGLSVEELQQRRARSAARGLRWKPRQVFAGPDEPPDKAYARGTSDGRRVYELWIYEDAFDQRVEGFVRVRARDGSQTFIAKAPIRARNAVSALSRADQWMRATEKQLEEAATHRA